MLQTRHMHAAFVPYRPLDPLATPQSTPRMHLLLLLHLLLLHLLLLHLLLLHLLLLRLLLLHLLLLHLLLLLLLLQH